MHNYKVATCKMFIVRNSYEVAVLAYFELGSLEKQ